MTPIRLLIVDDQFPPSSASPASMKRETLLENCGLEEVEVDDTAPASVDELTIEAVLATGEDDQGDYTFEAIRRAVTAGVGPEGWALILLDVTFGEQQHLGEEARERLLREFEELPIVMLTGRSEKELATQDDIPYLSKDSVLEDRTAAHTLKRSLLRHGNLSTPQQNALLELRDEVVESDEMKRVFRSAFEVADSDLPVLLRGETGAGKEVLSQYIHRISERRNEPFVAVNCAAIPSDLVESELFGHEEGAFTGALHQRVGKFEQADQGTIFLDEIGDMDLSAQVKLLRVLQNNEIERVGGDEGISIDVRVICATDRDLPRMMRTGEFREALHRRISVKTIHIPPLREHPADIVPLAERFLQIYMRKHGMRGLQFTEGARRKLASLNYRYNVGELESMVRRLVIQEESDNALIRAGDVERAKPVERIGDDGEEGERPLPSGLLTLANLEQQLAALPVSENDAALTGSLHRLDQAVAQLKKRLAGAALEKSQGFGADEPDRTQAVRRLQDDSSLNSSQAARTLCSILGVNQENHFTSQQIEKLLDAWKQGPPNSAASQDSADAS